VSRVSTSEGIRYGFSLLGYIVGVSFVAFIVIAIGAGIAGGSANNQDFGGLFLGGLVALVGVLIFYAGFIGTVYKVIVDGVSTAMERSEPAPEGPPGPPPEPERRPGGRGGRGTTRDPTVDAPPRGEARQQQPAGGEYPADEGRVEDRSPRNDTAGRAGRDQRGGRQAERDGAAEPSAATESNTPAEPISETDPTAGAEPSSPTASEADAGSAEADRETPSSTQSTGESEMTCPDCGASNRGQLDSCWKCGTDLT